MAIPPTENGIAQELQRIEDDFDAQRSSLQAESSRFEQWQTDWKLRQQAIDSALHQLKKCLESEASNETPAPLKLFSASTDSRKDAGSTSNS